ncbi:MAG: chromosomal replication initiator protein DnaA [Deltaproteobacteria bacterium]|nr:chromosomal replication initiator protein DnaA [Deltaproteobacteria bacterium]
MIKKRKIWDKITQQLQLDLPPSEFETWFSTAALEKCGPKLAEIHVPNKFVAAWLHENHSRKIQSAINQMLGFRPEIRFVYPRPYSPVSSVDDREPIDTPARWSRGLNPLSTFGRFITFENNRFAYESALNAADKPGDPFNPLFIFSNESLGKTHLLHAIGNRVLDRNASARIEYLTADRFVGDFSLARKNRAAAGFTEALRRTDLLLFDDIHRLGDREKSQRSFLSIFDWLLTANRQVAVSGRYPPKRIRNLIPELQSRLESGVLTEIGVPDQKIKIDIIKQRAKQEDIDIPEDVAFFLANNIKDFKTAEEYLVSLQAYTSLTRKEIDLSTVKRFLKNRHPRQIGVHDIQKLSASHFNISISDLVSNKKSRRFAYPRQVAMVLTRELTDLSLKQIGDAFGKRDHTTVIYALRRIDRDGKNPSSGVPADLERIQTLLMR